MTTQTAQRERAGRPGRLTRTIRTLGHDLGYILPGMFLSVLGLGVLLALFVAGVATCPLWIGALILPRAHAAATGFAQISRARVERWGAHVEPPLYRVPRPGMGGWMRLMLDGRRWLDLLFEMLLALPLRVTSFAVTVTWIGGALGGLTYPLWGIFLPKGDTYTGIEWLLLQLPDGWISPDLAGSYAVDAITTAIFGLFFLLTLPWMARLMALVDAAATRTALSGYPDARTVGGETR